MYPMGLVEPAPVEVDFPEYTLNVEQLVDA